MDTQDNKTAEETSFLAAYEAANTTKQPAARFDDLSFDSFTFDIGMGE